MPATAVLMPTTRPCPSASAPPELPGLSAASVWITLSISARPRPPARATSGRAPRRRPRSRSPRSRAGCRSRRRAGPHAAPRRRRAGRGRARAPSRAEDGEVGQRVAADDLEGSSRPSVNAALPPRPAGDDVRRGEQEAVGRERRRRCRRRPGRRRRRMRRVHAEVGHGGARRARRRRRRAASRRPAPRASSLGHSVIPGVTATLRSSVPRTSASSSAAPGARRRARVEVVDRRRVARRRRRPAGRPARCRRARPAVLGDARTSRPSRSGRPDSAAHAALPPALGAGPVRGSRGAETRRARAASRACTRGYELGRGQGEDQPALVATGC